MPTAMLIAACAPAAVAAWAAWSLFGPDRLDPAADADDDYEAGDLGC